MSAEKKSAMMAKRAVYQAGKASTSMSAVGAEMAEWQTKFKAEVTVLTPYRAGSCPRVRVPR
eukprot:4222273-Prymnesium_polylepis.1